MAKKRYHQDGGLPRKDPANRLRAKLSDIDAPNPGRALSEILYTAEQRGILPFPIDEELALTIHRLVLLAEAATEDDIREIRM